MGMEAAMANCAALGILQRYSRRRVKVEYEGNLRWSFEVSGTQELILFAMWSCQCSANAAVSRTNRRRKLRIMVETRKKNMLAKV
jgi:hypothetical protein